MPRYNTSFDLTVSDIELIETALQKRKKDLSMRRLALLSSRGGAGADHELEGLNATLADLHDLLGRLHNQKVFFRPDTLSDAPYVSG